MNDIDDEQVREGLLRELYGDGGSMAPGETSLAPLGTPSDFDNTGFLTEEEFREIEGLGIRIEDVTTFEDTVSSVLDEAADLIIERQKTYGPANIEEQGVLGIVNRITMDKAARIRKRLNGRIVNGEVVLDPIELGSVDEPGIINDAFDFIGYGVCLILLLRGEWGKPLSGDE